MRRLVHKPAALAGRQRRSFFPCGARAAATSPCRAFTNKPYHFPSSYLISFLLNLTHTTWSEVNVSLVDDRLSDAPQYRYLRYRSPNGGYGDVAEIEFYRNGVKLTGTGFGTLGSWANGGDTFVKALDGNVSTFFDASNGDGNFVGIDTQ